MMGTAQTTKARPAASHGRVEAAIDTSQINTEELPVKEFPAGKGYRVVISPSAHQAIWKHATQSVEEARAAGRGIVEVGGMLIGDVFRDADGPYLEVSAAIVGEHTRNEGAEMVFTPETWAQVTTVKDRQYPTDKIVGWYHTHPKFGVFLSDMDKYTHRQFFSPPWTAAFVLDPIQKNEGLFVWSGGEPLQVSHYWVGQQRQERVVVVSPEPAGTPSPAPPARTPESAVSQATFALSTVLGVLALLLVFGYVYMREVAHAETEKFVLGTLDTQKAALDNTWRALEALRQDLDVSRKQIGASQARMTEKVQHVEMGLQKIGLLTETLEDRVKGDERVLDHLQIIPTPVPQGAPHPAGSEPSPGSAPKMPAPGTAAAGTNPAPH